MLSRPTLIWINRLLWTLLVGTVLVLGTVVSLGRHYLPYIETHQAEVIAELQQRTGLHISAGHLRAYWQHLSPHLVVDDFALYNPADPAQAVLRIEHAEVRLGLFRSINGGTVAISKLEGRGVHLTLEEAELGQWRLPGFGGGERGNFERIADLLLAIYRAELTDSRIDLHFFGGGEAHLLGEQLRLQRVGDFRRLNVALTVADRASPLTVVVEATGDPRNAEKFLARGYAAFSGLDLTPLLPAAKAFGVDLRHGRIDGVAWLEWRAGADIELRGRIAMPLFDIASLSGQDLAPLKDLQAEFLVRDSAGQRRLWLPKLTLSWNERTLNFSQLQLTEDLRQPNTLQLEMPQLALASLSESALAAPALSEPLRKVLETLEPTGELRNLRLTIPTAPRHSELFKLRAEVIDVALGSWQGAPGAIGVTGYVDMGLQSGVFDLATNNFALTFPHIYREALHFDGARGQVGWRIEPDRVLVDSGPIITVSDAGRASALFALDLPRAPGPAPLMTLMVGLQGSAAEYRDRFIPYTLSPNLLSWLGGAVNGGKIPSGGFIYRGSLVGAQHLDYTVQLFLDVRDGRLKYQPGWPELEEVRAAVWVDDNGLLVQSPSARTFEQIATRDVQVEMHPGIDGSWLTVKGDVVAQNDDALRLLRESPLHQRVGPALDNWRWRGRVDARLDLGIPLGGTRPQELNVDTELGSGPGSGQLLLGDQGLTLTDVRGPLLYRSATGLQSSAIAANWYGKPLSAKVDTHGDELQIDVTGSAAMADLRDWLQQPLFDYGSGSADFRAALRIAGARSELTVESDLHGVEIKLPAPYNKAADVITPLTLTMPMAGARTLFASLGDLADLHLQWSEDRTLDSGVLRLGQSGKTALSSDRFIVTGTVPAIDLDDWRELLTHLRATTSGTASNGSAPQQIPPQISQQPAQRSQQPTQEQSQQLTQQLSQKQSHPLAAASTRVSSTRSSSTQPSSTPSSTQQAVPLAIQLRDLQIGEARAVGQTWRNLNLSGQREIDGWSFRARADSAAGSMLLPDTETQPWQVHLDYLHLAAPTPGAPSSLDTVDPGKVIPVDLRIDRLWRGDEEWGWVQLQLRPVADGLLVQQLAGQLRGIRIEPRGEQPASLSWLRQNGSDRSHFSGRLSVDDIGPVLQRWRFEKTLSSKSGSFDADMGWSGRPDQAKLKNIDGAAQLDFADGRFLKASGSTAGALKVVGIFNFANFLRRLQLDFSDVFKDGVSFDSMRGGFDMRQGVLTTAAPIEIKSPSSGFRIAGNIDFNTDQTDMELIATLPVARNLPWVAALAAGLPAAAGVYVASKIFENQVDKIASVAYDIDGPWTDPKVKLRRIFDDKLPQNSGVDLPKSTSPKKSAKKRSANQQKTEQVPEAAP
jgi:uncharacterized protein (TIGR02099 family)